MFKVYPKIHRLGHEENEGILLGTCYIQEKIDGANTSIWLEEKKTDEGVELEIQCGSRTRALGNSDFNGFVEYAKSHVGIAALLKDNPTYRLYGEWLVRHTLHYNETAYKQFYLFDVMVDEKFLDTGEVKDLAEKYGIKTPKLFDAIVNPTSELICQYVGKSDLAEKGEGIVIKNPTYLNKFGHPAYAKIVTQEFKEDNATVFGGNNRYSETYWEQYIVNKYMTLPRVQKIMGKLQPTINKRLDMEHTARIINTAYHDLITEEIWDIQKKVQVLNFKHLSRLASRKAAIIFHDILGNKPISVADIHRQNKLSNQ